MVAYVWWTPQPIHFQRYALLGPRYAPTLPAEGLITFSEPTPALGPYIYSTTGSVVAVNLGASEGLFDWAEVVWEWGPLRWVRRRSER